MANAALTEDALVGANEGGATVFAGTLAITNDAATTGVWPHARMRGGTITVPTGVTGVTFTFWARSRPGGELAPAYTDAEPPVAIVRTVAAPMTIPIPASLDDAYEIGIVSNVAGPETIEIGRKTA